MFIEDTTKFGGMFRGKVLDNVDPSKLGRLKVQIFGVFDSIEVVNIPWAVPAYPIFSGSGVGYGYFAVPEMNSFVWCFFEAGDLNTPVYFAEAPDGIHGLPAERLTEYPSTKVLETKSGIIVSINDKSGSEKVKIIHPSGAYLTIDSSGNVIISGTTIQINP